MRDYAVPIAVFSLIFLSIQTTIFGVAPHTMGYVLFFVVLIAGIIAYRRHKSAQVKMMYITLICTQLLFQVIFPYWVFHQPAAFNHPWPLHPEVLWETGPLAVYFFVLSFLIIPVLVLLFGRGAWCSYVCPFGALGETVGDRYRTRGGKAVQIPIGFAVLRWVILAVTVVATIAAFTVHGRTEQFDWIFLFIFILFLRALLSLAVNLFCMPRFGTRIWCKYFCPQGLLLGLLSRYGRFALVRDTALCVNCGTCNQNCSMGIDIARGPALSRTGDCVGCGVCVEVCPYSALSFTTTIHAHPTDMRLP